MSGWCGGARGVEVARPHPGHLTTRGGILTTCTLFRLLIVNKSGSVCKYVLHSY